MCRRRPALGVPFVEAVFRTASNVTILRGMATVAEAAWAREAAPGSALQFLAPLAQVRS